MSLQGPLMVIAEQSAHDIAQDVVQALGAAGAFPIIESNWADAPTAFVSVKPAGVVIADPSPPPSESAARMLCLQIATAAGPIVPTIALSDSRNEPPIPVALPADIDLPPERLVMRLQSAMRVRALHQTVLRRIENFAVEGVETPSLPATDPLDDAVVLIAGRGPLYPALSVAMGERVKMVGALSVEHAARHLDARDIDGVVIGDGFSPKMVEAFLTVLSREPRFRDVPVAVIGTAPSALIESLPNVDLVEPDPARLATRMVPLLRLHAFEQRLKRTLLSLDAGGTVDNETGLFTREAFWTELEKAVAEAGDRSQPLSVARFSFDGVDMRASVDSARLACRLIRDSDFGTREIDGSLIIAFTQSDLRASHVIARRIAAALKSALLTPGAAAEIAANITLATLKADDTLDTLMLRVMGSRMVAAE